jgi:hypothetical protein
VSPAQNREPPTRFTVGAILAIRFRDPGSFAEPLDPDDEHEVIRRVDQERDDSFMMLAEMQRAQ